MDLAVSETGTWKKLPTTMPASKDPVTDPIPAPRNFTAPIKVPQTNHKENRHFRIFLKQVTKPFHTLATPPFLRLSGTEIRDH